MVVHINPFQKELHGLGIFSIVATIRPRLRAFLKKRLQWEKEHNHWAITIEQWR